MTIPPSAAASPQRRATIINLLLATRPAFLSITLVACLLGSACAYASGVEIEVIVLLGSWLLALTGHAAANVLNDYYDALSGTDALNTQRLAPFTGGSRFIQDGIFSAHATARFGFALATFTIAGGLALVWYAGPDLLWIGAAGLLLGWAYSAPPLDLVSRGLGEIVIALCWLLVVIGADFVHRHSLDWLPVAAGGSYAVLVACILFINQFPDHDSDAATGKRTLVVRQGPEQAKWTYFGLAMLGYIWLVLQIGRDSLPQQSALAAFTLVLTFSAARELRQHASSPALLGRAIKLTIVAALLHGVLLTLALVWAAR